MLNRSLDTIVSEIVMFRSMGLLQCLVLECMTDRHITKFVGLLGGMDCVELVMYLSMNVYGCRINEIENFAFVIQLIVISLTYSPYSH